MYILHDGGHSGHTVANLLSFSGFMMSCI